MQPLRYKTGLPKYPGADHNIETLVMPSTPPEGGGSTIILSGLLYYTHHKQEHYRAHGGCNN